MHDGTDVKLRPKSFDMLHYLLERPGKLVSKTELLDSIWSPAVVTDDVVTQCLIDIRRAIGDRSQSMIRTVPRRGYILELPVRKTRTAVELPIATGSSPRTGRWLIASALIALTVLLAAWYGYSSRTPDLAEVSVLPAEHEGYSIAVLPFLDLSPQKDLGYFAGGMSEEVRNLLAGVKDLRVIARTSSFALSDAAADIDAVREQLDVTHVLQGSVRQSGEAVRITAQLVDAVSSEQVWSQTYDRSFSDVFAVQDEISVEVLNLLTNSLFGAVPERRPPHPEAYQLYLKAIHLSHQGTYAQIMQGATLMQRSLELDPDYAPAWRELSRMLWYRIGKNPRVQEDIRETVDALDRALALAPDDVAALAYRALHMADFDGDIAGGARLLEHALSLDATNESVIMAALSYTIAFGRHADAVVLGEYVVANIPLCNQCYTHLAKAYENLGRVDEAESTLRTALSLFNRGHGNLGVAQLMNGKPRQALESFAKEDVRWYRLLGTAMALHDLGQSEASDQALRESLESTGGERSWNAALASAWRNNIDLAFEEIEAALTRDRVVVDGQVVRWNLHRISWNLRDENFSHLRDDPRWAELQSEYGVSSDRLAAAQFDPLPFIQSTKRATSVD